MKTKRTWLLGSILVLLFLFTSCKKSFYNEYKDAYLLEKDNVYQEISLETLYNKMEAKEDFVVYYGQEKCTICYTMVGTMDLNAKEVGISVIYYLRSKILDLAGDDKRVDEMQAKIGFDSKNSADAAPRLWCFIDGKYVTGMANFKTDTDTDWDQPSKLLLKYYNENMDKE